MSAKAAASHDLAVKLVNDNLAKREPIASAVLAWGWLLKQGEGGIFHGETFKSRWFVLARVPHATVLIYYDRKCMDEDHILGYIDMRRVIAIREGSKMVNFDGTRSAVNGIVNKLKGFMSAMGGTGSNGGTARPVLELVTSSRVYTLCPCTGESPGSVSMLAATSGPSVYGKPLYLFGWPFPVPELEGAVMSSGEDGDEEDDRALAESDAEAIRAANAMLMAQDAGSLDNFTTWANRLKEVVVQEKATRVFPVVLLVDSTGTLPARLLLRVTPTEIALVSVDDKDVCYGSLPFNDLAKWDVQVESELHVTVRTRARLVARPDRTGFTTQRPTRPTSHFVFKSSAAKTIAQCIDHHVKALAQALGEVESSGDAGEEASVDDSEFVQQASDEDEEDNKKARAKLTRHQSTRAAAASASSSGSGKPAGKKPAKKSTGSDDDDSDAPRDEEEPADEDEEEEEVKPAVKAKPVTPKSTASGAASSSSSASKAKPSKASKKDSDDDSEEEKPKPKAKAAAKKASSDSDEPEEKPAKSKAKQPAKKAADSDDEEEEKPKATKKSTSAKKKQVASDDESEAEKPKKKAVAKKKVESDDESEEEKPKKASKAKAKKKASSDSDD